MGARASRTLAVVTLALALGTAAFALTLGGDMLMIVLGLVLAAASMQLFRHASPEREDE